MDISVFTDKDNIPSEMDLEKALGKNKSLWDNIKDHVHSVYPEGTEEWNYPEKKYGWSFRIKDKKGLYFIFYQGKVFLK